MVVERCIAAYATQTSVYLLCFTPDYGHGYAVADDGGFYLRSVTHPAEFVDRIESEENALLGFEVEAAVDLLKRLEKLLGAHKVNP